MTDQEIEDILSGKLTVSKPAVDQATIHAIGRFSELRAELTTANEARASHFGCLDDCDTRAALLAFDAALARATSAEQRVVAAELENEDLRSIEAMCRKAADRWRDRAETLEAALPDPSKLWALAEWFDFKYPNDERPEVQRDLRAWATSIYATDPAKYGKYFQKDVLTEALAPSQPQAEPDDAASQQGDWAPEFNEPLGAPRTGKQLADAFKFRQECPRSLEEANARVAALEQRVSDLEAALKTISHRARWTRHNGNRDLESIGDVAEAALLAASVDAATATDQEVAVDPEYHRFEQHMDRILGKRPDEPAGGGHE